MNTITYTTGSREDLENRLVLRRLKFERAIERCDYDEANIACAQIEYIERCLARMQDALTE
jgi:hypothetical protein